jgi:signal transduction histidine kinase
MRTEATATGEAREQGRVTPNGKRPRLAAGMSSRLLVLTIAFAMLAEVLIYVPSAARYWVTYLGERIAQAHLASLAVVEAPNNAVSPELARELLAKAGARAVALKMLGRRYLVAPDEMPPEVDATVDLRETGPFEAIAATFRVLFGSGNRVMLVVDAAPGTAGAVVETIIDEAPLRQQLVAVSARILTLSLFIALLTAGLVFISLQWLFVRPMRRLAADMTAFRIAPEDPSRVIKPSGRSDEIGVAEEELASLQRDLQHALTQKTHLAALGTAVAKINHDLRNILATAQLMADRLRESEDPTVRRIAPRLVASIDRAVDLCARTMKYGRADEPPPEKEPVDLARLWQQVADTVAPPGDNRITFDAEIPPGMTVQADREQLFRVLLNLARNAVGAIAGDGRVRLSARNLEGGAELLVADSGSGLPEAARLHLFEPFVAAGRSGGTGLGLAIARDLVTAHGGEIGLLQTGPEGTTFRIFLPAAA